MVKQKIKQHWYWYLILALMAVQVLAFTLWGEHSFIAVHDNLDLFVAHNKIMKNQGIFFGKEKEALFLGGVSRNLLGSEFSLYNILYYFLSPYTAYVCGYFLKIFIGFSSFLLLVREIYGEKFQRYKSFACLTAAAFSMVPVFPAYGIAFVSLPLIPLLLIKIKKTPAVIWYVLLFVYPMISYFSYFGIFILGYMALAFLLLPAGKFILFYVNRKKDGGAKKEEHTFGTAEDIRVWLRWGLAVLVLALGYMIWEYRLFGEMLFKDTVTIRDSMVQSDVSLAQMVKDILLVLVNPGFHAQSSHQYWILPITVIALLLLNAEYLKEKNYKAVFKSPINGIFGFILLNCMIYGLYELRVVQKLVEMILPPLKGFQFNRTIFFNPFLWYFLFFLILKEGYDRYRTGPVNKMLLNMAAVICLLVCMFFPQVYNDFYSNCYHHAYEILKQKPSTQLSFKEFYSEELFEKIKTEIGYEGEWAAAYGMHPAVLQYNGIATLDGYLGMYSEEYKQQFGKLIAPALENSEEFNTLFRESGIRAYLYSGAGENTYQPLKDLSLQDTKLYIDGDVFREMNGCYIFSRIAISNGQQLGLRLKGVYTHESSPYTIYVYETVQSHANG